MPQQIQNAFDVVGKAGYADLVEELSFRTTGTDASHVVILGDEASCDELRDDVTEAGGEPSRLLSFQAHQRKGRLYTDKEIQQYNSRPSTQLVNAGTGAVKEITRKPLEAGARRPDYTVPWSLGNEPDVQALIRNISRFDRDLSDLLAVLKDRDNVELEKLPIRTVIQLSPSEDQEKYLDLLRSSTKVEYYATRLNWPDPSTGKYEPEGIFLRGGAELDLARHFQPLSEWKVEPPKEIVQNLLVEGCLHVFTGLFGTAKTMFAYEMAAAILEKRPVGGHFIVQNSYPVLNLCLDMSPGLQFKYASYFGLHQNPRFIGLNPDDDVQLGLDDPNLQAMASGKIVLIDTMLDYADFKEAAQSQEWIVFMNRLRDLMKVYKAVAIVLLVHPTKSVEHDSTVAATKFLKDSVTFGGKVDVAFAFVRVQKSSKIFVERIKGRPWDKPITFTIATHDHQGNSYIDRGTFPVIDAPGEAGNLGDHLTVKSGRKSSPAKEEKVQYLLTLKDMSYDKMAEALSEKFGGDHTKSTVYKWLREKEENQF